MKVLNLRCSLSHHFEGWFASQDDYQSQLDRALIECPMCGDTAVQRLPSAPHLLTASSRAPAASPEAVTPERSAASGGLPTTTPVAPQLPPPGPPHMQVAWMRAVQHIIKNTDDVGPRFAEEARRMHYGETGERSIRGQATADEAKALHEEGIDVMPIPMPAALKGPLQ